VLDGADGPSSLAASSSTVVGLLESRIEVAAANMAAGDPVGVGCHLVAFSRAGNQAGATRVLV
jgi:hypothetical protein